MAECTELTEFDGTLPNSGQTDEENIVSCTNFMNWLVNDFTQEFNEKFPTVCAAADAGQMLNYKGSFDSNRTYNLGDVVSYNDKLYISDIDNNNDTPPTNWSALEQFVPLSGGTMTGTLITPRVQKITNGGTGFDIYKNDIKLYSNFGTSNEKSMRFTMYDDGSKFKISPFDGNSEYPRKLYFDYETMQWTINGKEIATIGNKTGYTQVSKINGWTGNLYYKKFLDGTVVVTGAPKNSSGSSGWGNRKIGTLPAGFRPGTTIFQGVASNRHNAGGVPKAQIASSGDIYCETIGDYYMYMTFIFKAEN